MQPKNLGVIVGRNELLTPDWYKHLDESQLAAYIRYHYIRLRENAVNWDSDVHRRARKWDGGKDAIGVNHKSVWLKISKAVTIARADPGAWVCAHFGPWAARRLSSDSSQAPDLRPGRLAGTQSYDIYVEYCDKIKDFIQKEFEMTGITMARRYRSIGDFGFSDQDKALYVVCDESYVTAPPFFRHAFAAKFGAITGVEKYLWAAAADYEAKQRFYDAAVEDWCVTEQLREAVIEIRQHWKDYTE